MQILRFGKRVKNGYAQGKQRYKCKGCGKTYRKGDLREKYSNEQRLRVIKWYLVGAGIMSIERMEGVPNPLIIKWIRKFSKILRSRLNEIKILDDARKIAKRHYMTKTETSLVESFNSLIRHYLARFNRRTKRYSKSMYMICNSILMLFNKNLLLSIIR